MLASAKQRAIIAGSLLAFGFTGFSFRLVDIQVTKHDEYAEMAAENHCLRQTIYARRGAILDAPGSRLLKMNRFGRSLPMRH